VLPGAYEKHRISCHVVPLGADAIRAPLVAGGRRFTSPAHSARTCTGSGAPRYIGLFCAVHHRSGPHCAIQIRNLHIPTSTLKMVEDRSCSGTRCRYPRRVPELRRRDCCVLGSENVADAAPGRALIPAWLCGQASHDVCPPRSGQRRMPAGLRQGVRRVRRRLSPIPATTFYCPEGTYLLRVYDPMWLENLGSAPGRRLELTEAGSTARRHSRGTGSGCVRSVEPDRRVGICSSSRPSGATGARSPGAYQVELKTGRALGPAYGVGCILFDVVVGNKKPRERQRRPRSRDHKARPTSMRSTSSSHCSPRRGDGCPFAPGKDARRQSAKAANRASSSVARDAFSRFSSDRRPVPLNADPTSYRRSPQRRVGGRELALVPPSLRHLSFTSRLRTAMIAKLARILRLGRR